VGVTLAPPFGVIVYSDVDGIWDVWWVKALTGLTWNFRKCYFENFRWPCMEDVRSQWGDLHWVRWNVTWCSTWTCGAMAPRDGFLYIVSFLKSSAYLTRT
jgi:hypothetical protein